MADNLAKLATLTELHEKGVVSDKEYEKRKKKLLKKNWPIWVRIPLGLIGLFIVISTIIAIIPMGGTPKGILKVGSAQLPACDSSQTQAALANAVKNNANSNQNTLTLLSLSNQVQVAMVAAPPELDCTALAYFNDGQHNLSYRIFIPDQNNPSNFMVQFKETDGN